MTAPSRPSFSSSPGEPSIRRLGVRSSASIEKPIRTQLVLGIAALLVLVAIPIYYFRSPSEETTSLKKEEPPLGFSPVVPAEEIPSEVSKRVRLATPERVKCASSSGATGRAGRACDQLPALEKSLADAIREAVDCAPQTGDPGTLNYVMKVDFQQKTLHVFPGASGQWKGPQARRATRCVKQALNPPDWAIIAHKFRYYEIAILARYQPPTPTATPLFE
ncbi:MAG: hypothetical protein MK135_08345 [Polyangiaceae bacterium]|nr:hypothetical protein [Polyangiaceae bacterium]